MTNRRSRRRVLRAGAAVTALLAAAVLVLSGCTSSSSGSKTFQFSTATAIGTVIPAAQRKPAPTITGANLQGGGNLSLAAQRGKVVVMNFWAHWCGPCTAELPSMSQLYRQNESRGVTFLGINTDDSVGGGQTFVSDHHIAFPNITDQQGRIQLQLGNIPGNLPFTVLIDQRGRVAAVYLERFTSKDLQKSIDALHPSP